VHGVQRRDVVVLRMQSLQVRQPRRGGQLRQPAGSDAAIPSAAGVASNIRVASHDRLTNATQQSVAQNGAGLPDLLSCWMSATT
jgi:hypothetical protein